MGNLDTLFQNILPPSPQEYLQVCYIDFIFLESLKTDSQGLSFLYDRIFLTL